MSARECPLVPVSARECPFMPNSVQDVCTDQQTPVEVVKVETTPFYEVWTVVMHLFWL